MFFHVQRSSAARCATGRPANNNKQGGSQYPSEGKGGRHTVAATVDVDRTEVPAIESPTGSALAGKTE